MPRREVKLAAHGEASVLADFSAGRAVGQGRIEWRAEILDALSSKTLDTLAAPTEPGYDPRPELRRLEALWHRRLHALYGAGYHDEKPPGV